MPQFNYLPLPPRRTRLLMILPQINGSGAIRCQMCTISLDDPIEISFTAMSYTWGDPTAKKEIEIDGYALKTTDSVYEMLLQREHGIWLWIDAVCINQADFDERAAQVRLMGRIYSTADRVVIWLGPTSEDSGMAIDFIRELKEILPSTKSNDTLYDETSAYPSHPKWVALGRFCEHHWFSRLWVVQEVVLASNLLEFSYGSRRLDWSDFGFVLLQLQRVQAFSCMSLDSSDDSADSEMKMTITPVGWSLFAIVYNIKKVIPKEELDIQKALQYVSYFSEASDPRDKIYGLYGIALGADDFEMTPDYHKSVAEVYLQTTGHLITKSNSLHLLVDAGIDNHEYVQLPSWVPNYNLPRPTIRIGCDHPGKNIYNASGSASPIIQWAAGSSDLTLSGAVIDIVKYLGNNSTNRTKKELRDWMLEAFHLVELSNVGMPERICDENLWRTLIGNRRKVGETRTRTSNSAEAIYGTLPFGCFKYWCQNPDRFIGIEQRCRSLFITKVYIMARTFLNATADIISKRKFGITLNGHPGILPAASAIGDKVAMILGLSTLFIVRECLNENGEQKYVLVGECYLHNLMDGEGLKGRQVENLIFQ